MMAVCSLLNHCSLTPYVITIIAVDSETHTHNSIDPLTACNPLTAAGYSLQTTDVMICAMTCTHHQSSADFSLDLVIRR